MWTFIQNISLFLSNVGFNYSNLSLLAVFIGIIVIAFLFFVRSLGIFVLTALEQNFPSARFAIWLNLVEKINTPIIIFNGLYFASLILPLPASVNSLATSFYILISIIFLIDLIKTFIIDVIKFYFYRRGNVSPEAIKTVVNFASVISTILLWILAILIFLQISQVDTQALLGGLGIASVIVAFSFQNILKDIFAFFSIYLDKSYSVGDYVAFDNFEGTIKEIRLRTTKIRALKGQELIVSNHQLTNTVIQNYKPMKRRRVTLKFRVDKNLSAQKSTKLVSDFHQIFNQPAIKNRVELGSVVLDEITDQGLQYRFIYYFAYQPGEANYIQHLDYKEKINLAILDILAKHHIKLIQVPSLKSTID